MMPNFPRYYNINERSDNICLEEKFQLEICGNTLTRIYFGTPCSHQDYILSFKFFFLTLNSTPTSDSTKTIKVYSIFDYNSKQIPQKHSAPTLLTQIIYVHLYEMFSLLSCLSTTKQVTRTFLSVNNLHQI